MHPIHRAEMSLNSARLTCPTLCTNMVGPGKSPGGLGLRLSYKDLTTSPSTGEGGGEGGAFELIFTYVRHVGVN